MQQLTEIAVRALSPGTNDPYTARNVMTEIARPLRVVALHPDPPIRRLDDEGQLRVVLHLPTGEQVLDEVLDDLRANGVTQPHVVRAIVDLAARLGRGASPEIRGRLRTHADLVVEAWAHDAQAFDAERMRAHLARAEVLSRG